MIRHGSHVPCSSSACHLFEPYWPPSNAFVRAEQRCLSASMFVCINVCLYNTTRNLMVFVRPQSSSRHTRLCILSRLFLCLVACPLSLSLPLSLPFSLHSHQLGSEPIIARCCRRCILHRCRLGAPRSDGHHKHTRRELPARLQNTTQYPTTPSPSPPPPPSNLPLRATRIRRARVQPIAATV